MGVQLQSTGKRKSGAKQTALKAQPLMFCVLKLSLSKLRGLRASESGFWGWGKRFGPRFSFFSCPDGASKRFSR